MNKYEWSAFKYELYRHTKYYEHPEMLEDYPLYIPRAYARGESNIEIKSQEEASKIDHYEIRVVRQVGSTHTLRDTYTFLYLPKQKRYVAIILYPRGGINIKPDEHKFILREFDELDRRIVLGFMDKYCIDLFMESHRGTPPSDHYFRESLGKTALKYKYDQHAKRIRVGSKDKDPEKTRYIAKNVLKIKPYEESYEKYGMFADVSFI